MATSLVARWRYGLIECSVGRDEAPDAGLAWPGLAWYTVPGFI